MIEAEVARRTDKGRVRDDNEDAAGSVIPAEPAALARKGVICAVADGLGGHAAGQVASDTALKTLFDEYYAPSNSGRVEPALRHAVQVANLQVHDLAQRHLEYRTMATTLTALALVGSTGYVAHVGDTRIYHLRDTSCTLITQDHTEAAELVRMRILKADAARNHPGRNVLTRTIGHHLIVRPDFLRVPLRVGDIFVLCTDGLWSELSDQEIAEAARDEPEAACQQMVDLCLSRDCQDNVTVEVVKIRALDPETTDSRGSGLLGSILGRFSDVRMGRIAP